MKIVPSPSRYWPGARNSVLQPASLTDRDTLIQLRTLKPDLIVVVAYGIPCEDILDFPHTAALISWFHSKYRGAAPIQHAVLNGETVTGVTSMYMAPEMDAGDIILMKKTAIGDMETAGELSGRLAVLGAELLSQTLTAVENGTVKRIKQNGSEATFAPPLTKEQSPIDWTRTGREIVNQVRGLNPWPVATATLCTIPFKIFRAEAKTAPSGLVPGAIVSAGCEGIEVACADGTVVIKQLQAPGCRQMTAAEYLRGHPISPYSAREAALMALTRYRRDAANSDAALNAILMKENLEDRDSALSARIFYGVIQNMALLDFYISAYSNVQPSQMEPQVLDILRLSAYQLVFMSKIPVSAAVSEGVELVKQHANPRASRLVNAVLRKLSSNLERLPEVNGAELDQELSIRYSHPSWLVRTFLERLGVDETKALLETNNGSSGVSLMVNTLKTDVESALASLRSEGCETKIHPWFPNCLILNSMRHIERLTAFCQGLVYVQDPAAASAVFAAGPEAGMRIIDGCAAPGGKSFAAAIAMKDTGCILSCDVNEKKLGRIAEGARRLELTTVKTRVLDARVSEPSLFDSADIVLADVPCSGFGVIRKKPEIRYKREEDIARYRRSSSRSQIPLLSM
jgi:16S rRNA (cytosine967-C5)-methyltransferase